MDTPAAPLTARADVEVDRPERWAKQLVSHLSRKAPLESTAEGEELAIGSGRGVVRAEAARLVLLAHAPDAASLERVQEVLGGHLERFAAKEGVTVRWES
ncbi:DUF2218 domain-containing protein [uncultured Pseudokineococcus sp.]|uniref:DUF2218 domain-containing protein n=1 Tax=uncultured Pseudokineococcus sp. TaxID=1642928 RepID=UPI002613DF7F|nr:DUF2218 domain-containing protein [uncultured Pseudokineococcus sp.]